MVPYYQSQQQRQIVRFEVSISPACGSGKLLQVPGPFPQILFSNLIIPSSMLLPNPVQGHFTQWILICQHVTAKISRESGSTNTLLLFISISPISALRRVIPLSPQKFHWLPTSAKAILIPIHIPDLLPHWRRHCNCLHSHKR
jgi:hypothetical protein